MAADRARELERKFQKRRGHTPQLSISDDNHHVTEVLGDLYGTDFDQRRISRPLSFLPDSLGEPFDPFPTNPISPPAKSPLRPQRSPELSAAGANANANTAPAADTASQQFPLNDTDYESSPASLAMELSNLQAIRRMSMDVHNSDPDLPSFKSYANGPVSPPLTDDESDPAKLFWVPARLHPELAPKEFKTFIEEKVHTIRRRSGDSTSLSPDTALGRQDSSGGLRRKKSMLSRQIDTGSGYRDGADRLERKRSDAQPTSGLANLHELENIVEDPTGVVRRMSLVSRSPTPESADGDTPIIPGAIGGLGTLKRSTRTAYRRGSVRREGRVPLSRRLVSRNAETDTEESPSTSPVHPTMPEIPQQFALNRVQSEPVNSAFESPSNFSRPTRRGSSPPSDSQSASAEDGRPNSAEERPRPQPKAFHSRIASNGRTSAFLPGYKPPTLASPVPHIVETPPPEPEKKQQQYQLPERHSSRQPPPQQQPQPQPQQQSNGHRQQPQAQPQAQPQPPKQHRQSPSNRPNKHAQAQQNSPIKPSQSLDDLVQHPSPMPGNNTRVDNLSIIPNLPDEKKTDKKPKDKKDEGRKTSWGWLVGGDSKKEKEDKDKEMAKKVKNKLSKPQEKGDDTRLDVLQSSIHGSRSRESVVLDRDSVKLEEERKKESMRKTSSDGKKEKEPGLLSSIFGGGKKKGEKEAATKKNATRGLSPDPPPRVLKPDIDYNWTRFSILEERAIYRMAHIKLANPRRELYSQVLLSNFMYSYLAKVQQMHPQIQIGNSKQARQAQAAQQSQQAAQQKKEQQQQQQQQQPEEFSQYQRYQQVSHLQSSLNAADKQQQQQQEPQDKSDEWSSAQNQQDSSRSRSPQDDGNAYNQNPRDSHHSNHAANGGGYSVSNTQKYLGQPSTHGGHSESDTAKSGDDDMW